MTYEELKAKCDEALRLIKDEEFLKRYKREISAAKRYYDNKRDLYEELLKRKDEIDNRYTIPYLLGLTKEYNLSEQPELVQVKAGASGGIDIDTDWSPEGKQAIHSYLEGKYGKECVFHVGTFSTLGPASAAKDLMRIYKVDFKMSNALNKDLSWEENIKLFEETNRKLYDFYVANKQVLDMVPYFINKIRQGGTHAGGVVITDKPIYNYVPVNRVSGDLATAFPESGSEQVLDEIGIVKFDILGITILQVIDNAIDMIQEKMFLVREDGILKVVPESYVDKELKKF